LGDVPIASTEQHMEAAQQLKTSCKLVDKWKKTDRRFSQLGASGVSITDARERIGTKMREAVVEGRADRCSKHKRQLVDAAALAEDHETLAAASQC